MYLVGNIHRDVLNPVLRRVQDVLTNMSGGAHYESIMALSLTAAYHPHECSLGFILSFKGKEFLGFKEDHATIFELQEVDRILYLTDKIVSQLEIMFKHDPDIFKARLLE